MHRRSDRAAVAGLLGVIAILAACGPPETDPGALRRQDGTALYRDGVYAAAYTHTNPDGWRPFLQIRVRAGVVDQVCFGAVNAAGRRLLDDEHYLEQLRLETGVVLADQLATITGRLLERQLPAPAIDPGAAGWGASFETLARAVLTSARHGMTVHAVGPELIPAPGPYVASDAPDALGWRAELVVVYDRDGAVAAAYREVRTDPDGSTRQKALDERYQARFEAVTGHTTALVTAALVEQLLSGGPSSVDGVTGATVTSRRFSELASRIDTRRVAVPLPGRLCR